MLPNFLGIGAPRCGTTWLYKQLYEHQEVFIPRQKEIHFFDQNYEKGLSWYETFFDNSSGKKAIGEITPDYISAENAPERIKKDLGNIRLILMLRNPVERAYSHYWNMINKHKKLGIDPDTPFHVMVDMEPRIIDQGRYFKMLQKFLTVFQKEEILIIFHEELKNSPNKIWIRVCRFLGVDESFRPAWLQQNVNTGQSQYVKLQSLRYMDRFFYKVKLFSIANWLNKINQKGIPEMPKDLKDRLKRVYSDDIHHLEKLCKRDLAYWR
jgi:Sulfotransferase domain